MIYLTEENLAVQVSRSREGRPGFLNLYGSERPEHDDGLPGTAPFVEETCKALLNLEKQLLDLGLVPYIKAEVEFATHKETIGPNAHHWKSVQAEILKALENSGDTELATKVRNFGPREVMMYDIINRDERTSNIVETLKPENYFDGGDMMELQLRHDPSLVKAVAAKINAETNSGFSPVQSYIDDLNALGQTIYDKCNEYGLVLALKRPSPHVNISFWDQNGNILDPAHPDYRTKGKWIAEGVLKSTFDSFPIYLGNNSLIKNIDGQYCNLNVDRLGSLRDAHGRLETRPTSEGLNKDEAEPFLWAARDLAGALYGLRRHHPSLEKRLMDTEYVPPVQEIHKLTTESPDDHSYKITRHVLNGSYHDGERLHFPSEYIGNKSTQLAEELFSCEENNNGPPKNLLPQDPFFIKDEPYTEGLIGFFQQIHLEKAPDGQYRIIWPENTSDGHYTFTAKPTDRNKDGLDPITYSIDIKTLQKNVPHAIMVPGMICTGYELSRSYKNAPDIIDARRDRMAESPALKLLGETVHGGLMDQLDRRIKHIRAVLASAPPQIRQDIAPETGTPPMPPGP